MVHHANNLRILKPLKIFAVLTGTIALVFGMLTQIPAYAAAPISVIVTGDFLPDVTADKCEKWATSCDATEMAPLAQWPGIYEKELNIPAGDWKYKIKADAQWRSNEGENNMALSIQKPMKVVFQYDSFSGHIGIRLPEYKKPDVGETGVPAPVRNGSNESFYFVITDRFANGNKANDDGHYGSDPMKSGFDPKRIGFYHGGDIAGLRQKLDYIKNLGATAIWMTPSFVNQPVQGSGDDASAGYHGYWTTDFTRIDPHLGSNEELKQLIREAHEKNLKVYFDIIINHTADLIKLSDKPQYIDTLRVPYKDKEGNPVDLLKPTSGKFPGIDPKSFPYEPKRIGAVKPESLMDTSLYHNRGDGKFEGKDESFTLGDFFGLDDLMTEDPRVVKAMTDIYNTWARTGIDGFRIDTVKHVNFDFWKQWTEAVQKTGRQANKDFFMFGEVYNTDARDLAPYSRNTHMGGTLDFAFQSSALDFLKGGKTDSLSGLFAADDMYTTPTSSANDQPTFLGNHDMGRIGYLLGMGLDKRLERSILGHQLMFLTRGQPVVYYGDEQGFVGVGKEKDGTQKGDDKHARQSLFASQVGEYTDQDLLTGGKVGSVDHYDTNAKIYQKISEVSKLRRENKGLKNGEQIELYKQEGGGPGIYAFARVDRSDHTEYVVAVNNTESEKSATFKTLTPGAHYTGLLGEKKDDRQSGADGTFTVNVPAFGAVVYKADKTVATPKQQTITLDVQKGGAVRSTTTTLDGQPNVQFALAGVSATLAENTWAETSFSWRRMGDTDWKPLGVDTSGAHPRVFHDVQGLPAGALVEYRAVSKDAAGHTVTDVQYASVNIDQREINTAKKNSMLGKVTIPGDHGKALGCENDWDPACDKLVLEKEKDSGWYTGTFTLEPGTYTYKIAKDGTWNENYGMNGARSGVPDGNNAEYKIYSKTPVTFYYNPETHEFFNTSQHPAYTLPGDFGKQLGCTGEKEGNWDPACLKTLMSDPDGDGEYTFSTLDIPAGSIQVKATENLKWGTGEIGCNGGNCGFEVKTDRLTVFHLKPSEKRLWVTDEDPTSDMKYQAHWLDRETFAWPSALGNDGSWTLYSSTDGKLKVEGGKVTGADYTVPLQKKASGLSQALRKQDPQLRSYVALEPKEKIANIEEILKGEVRIVYSTLNGVPQYSAGVQIPRILDVLYAEQASKRQMGVSFEKGGTTPTLALWAPTAQNVELQLFNAPDARGVVSGEPTKTLPMHREEDGSWTITGDESWIDRPYRYNVKVYVPTIAVNLKDDNQKDKAGKVVTQSVTDPNSTALSVNSTHSVIANLNDPKWAPAGWPGTPPVLKNFSEHAIYELHVRDFSIADKTVPDGERGTYKAFTRPHSDGMKHLKKLSEAGMNTIHLLPTNDIGSIPELRTEQKIPAIPKDAGRDHAEQQKAVGEVKDKDGFNWGYDPYHYTTPEGSYATNGNQYGGARTKEYREMVAGLHQAGYQVILDQVFNHTYAAAQDEKSVFEKIVPGYYHRLDLEGNTMNTPCCAEVATEHAMMEDLMIDSLVTWAKTYKVDGFRFDLMGFHSRVNMEKIRSALNKLTMANDGVNGQKMYLYGEGWNFGSVKDNARFVQASQGKLRGTGIGSFNDHLRDGVHGHGNNKYLQGFGNGLWSDPNGKDGANAGNGAEKALQDKADMIRLGLAGNLADYAFYNFDGTWRSGSQMNGMGYAAEPYESVNYVDAHDNETLYDFNAWALPENTSMADRVRMNTLSLATVALGQSPMFWHAGTDILRSKSLDRNSYNSGDHFNKIDWSLETNNFGIGLPPEWDNNPKDKPEEQQWTKMAALLRNTNLTPKKADMESASRQALDLLRLRKSSPLFTLGSAALIKDRVTFPDAGSFAAPGLLMMRITDPKQPLNHRSLVGGDIDPERNDILVVFNATKSEQTKSINALKGINFTLSKIQQNGTDDVVKKSAFEPKEGKVTVPPRTVAVFEALADNTIPVVHVTPAVVDLELGASEPDVMTGVTATDAADAADTLIIQHDGVVDTSKVGEYKVLYKAIDPAGNISDSVSRTYRVLDRVAPVVSIDPVNVNLSVGEKVSSVLTGVSAKDAIDGDLPLKSIKFAIEAPNGVATIDGDSFVANKPGIVTVTYKATDKAGNVSEPVVRKYVISDVEQPIVTVAPEKIEVPLGGVVPNLLEGVSAKDGVDGDLAADAITAVVDQPAVFTQGKTADTQGTFTVTYTAKDKAGNTSQPKTRTYIVKDKVAPVLTVEPKDVEVQVGAPIGHADFLKGVSAKDNVDGPIANIAVAGVSEVSTAKAGTFTITYTVTDKAGNQTTVKRTYRIIDTTVPVMSAEPTSVKIAQGAPLPNLLDGVTATDNSGEDLKIIVHGSVDTAKAGTYEVTYEVRDSAGNVGKTKRVYTVVAESNAPGDESGGNTPGVAEPGDVEPGGNTPGVAEPGDVEPGGERPGGEQPGKEQPSKEQPGGQQPGEGEPGQNLSGDGQSDNQPSQPSGEPSQNLSGDDQSDNQPSQPSGEPGQLGDDQPSQPSGDETGGEPGDDATEHSDHGGKGSYGSDGGAPTPEQGQPQADPEATPVPTPTPGLTSKTAPDKAHHLSATGSETMPLIVFALIAVAFGVAVRMARRSEN
ncbi:pullulanase-type alpha-1,6-glucosidase [Arcanobacterium canis]|uniref:Pullulanase-type alpha-1,6-glucosidase n=1 Tax=Arcanobacterium canis TaxID=999183 RepID=A0ABY8FYE0_9ACTO|nr:pullulanase-type alpha-1,6-glucosidase [Arcanobacterium canis]WFM83478.1 pullulanase-type alpha-1,6-glucosidase [Arcanobacterium canis]